jgi:DNA-directed RNA polymerase specialized sigma24 family protein
VDSPVSQKEWILTKEAFDGFLAKLDMDRARAAEKYETVRQKLLKYFLWCGSVTPDIDTDETINRVARKVEEGENVYNPNAYIYGVAKFVNAESVKIRNRNQQIDDEAPEFVAPVVEDEESDVIERGGCFDRCLRELGNQSREIITEYYSFDKGKKIQHRKQLAARFGMTLNALRIKAHRLRVSLEACVRECLGECA